MIDYEFNLMLSFASRVGRGLAFFVASYALLMASPYDTSHNLLVSLAIGVLGLVNQASIVGTTGIAVLLFFVAFPKEVLMAALN